MAFNKSGRGKGSKSKTVEKEGYLWVKQNASTVKSKEKQKYIVLHKSFGDGTCLEWYENFDAFIAHKNPVKLKLDEIDYIGPVDMSKEYTYAFVLFGGGQSQLTMAAKNEAERAEWIKALNHWIQNGRKSSSTSPTTKNNCGKTGYPVKLKDYTCTVSQDILRGSSRDYVMIVGPDCIDLISTDMNGAQKRIVSWLLENIKSYESRPLEQNPLQKLLSIDTGRRSLTGQGKFNFFTPYGDQIKNQISQNTKRSYFRKMNSTESFNTDMYSSSPESTRSLSYSPSKSSFSPPVSVPRRATLSAREGPIPFHKYDPPAGSNRDSYAPYIQQPNGYVDIFTDPRKVEENRMRHGSYSGTFTCRSPNLDDHPAYIDISYDQSSESRAGYIQVLPSGGTDSTNAYIDILPEESPHSYAYLEVLEEEDSRHEYIEVLGDVAASSVSPKKSTLPDDHPAYIEVLGDDETTSQSLVVSRESSEDLEIYIDVGENRKTFAYESREHHSDMLMKSREGNFGSNGQHVETRYESREESLKTYETSEMHVTYNSLSRDFHEETREVHITHSSLSREVRHELRQTRESNASSPRWPHSVTSQTSTDFDSLSSESDVFQDHREVGAPEREMSIPEVPEVFTEESANSDNVLTNSEADATNSEDISSKSDDLEIKPNGISGKTDNVSLKHNDDPKKTSFLAKPILVASKSATLPTRSEGFPTNSDVKSSDMNETRNERSPTPNNRSSKARSWHSENGFTSGNSTSTSESENTRDSHECSDDENSDHTQDSPRDSFSVEVRNRSHTAGELHSLRNNAKVSASSMFEAFQRQLTHPQEYSPCKNPPSTGDTRLTQNTIIAQLENPILGVSQLPNTKNSSNAVDFKYICAECGWHKKWKKRSSLKPSFRTKQCPICGKPVTRQDAKSAKGKEKSSGSIFNKIIRKGQTRRRSSEEKLEKKDFLTPERPSATAEPLFIKRVRDPAMFGLGRHSPSLDPKRSVLGIAPSAQQTLNAVSLDGEAISRGSISYDDSASLQGINPLAASLSEGSVTNGISSPFRTISPTPPLPKSSPSTVSGNYPLGRTKSSPPLSGGVESSSTSETSDVQEFEKVSCKNSGLTLPILPEVEDLVDTDHQGFHSRTSPPVIPPRTREIPPPLPPRRGSSPVAPREDVVRLRRAQTDPTFTLPALPDSPQVKPKSPQVKPKSRISRTLTDPGNDSTTLNDNIRNAISLGNLLEDGDEGLQVMKIVSLSLGDGIDSDAPPPPLPPRKGSGQAQSATATPRWASDESERLLTSSDPPRIEARTSAETRRPVPEKPAGNASPKLPLSTRRSVEAKRDFQLRKPLFSISVDEQ